MFLWGVMPFTRAEKVKESKGEAFWRREVNTCQAFSNWSCLTKLSRMEFETWV